MGSIFSAIHRITHRYSEQSGLIVSIKTGDSINKGTNAAVKIAFVNEHGLLSRDHTLNTWWKTHFEGGAIDHFEIPRNRKFDRVKKIDLCRINCGLNDRWYVEWVQVKSCQTGIEYVFPVHRWVPRNRRLRIEEYDAVLPQHDGRGDMRSEEIQRKSREYEWEVKIEGWLPEVKTLPEDEQFSTPFLVGLAFTGFELHRDLKDQTCAEWLHFDEILHYYNDDTFPRPPCISFWQTDSAFGRQRLNHCNPGQIRLCKIIPKGFAVCQNTLPPGLLGEFTLEEALEKNKLFIIDYKVLKDLKHAKQTVCAPIALFFLNKRDQLMPVAIQLFQDHSDDNPVFYPKDDYMTWLLAKMWFNNADASFHQSCAHLGFTHLVMEAASLATHRSLSPSHPIFRLLAPHFLFLLAINSLALVKLVNEGGWVDTSMSIGREGMFEIMTRQLKNWRLDVEGTLPEDLKQRGVYDETILPNYFYRDDGLRIYKAIRNYVKKVIDGFYSSVDDILQDKEIQEWARCLSDPYEKGGVGIPGVHGGGKFDKKVDLVDVCTSFIFIGSAQHAAVNFGQYEDYGYPSFYPAILNGDPPSDKSMRTYDDIEKALPSKKTTLGILEITKTLSTRGTQPLGNFEVQYLYDLNSVRAAGNLRRELVEIGCDIDDRNKKLPYPYTHLRPLDIPNAISI